MTAPFQYRIPIIKIGRFRDSLVFIMEIPVAGKIVFMLRRGHASVYESHFNSYTGSGKHGERNAYVY